MSCQLVLYIMNSKSRILPHLNICYLQKKAFEAHRKKIESIKQSLRSSLSNKKCMSQNYSMDDRLSRKDSVNKMCTIKQQDFDGKLYRMRPLNRQKYFDQLKENQRLLKRIQTCQSTISRKNIEVHKLRNQQYKNRISKFKNDPNSHKSLLKSKHSLQLLQNMREKEKLKQFAHFHNQNIESKKISIALINQKSITQLSKVSGLESQKIKSQIRQGDKKQSFNKLLARRTSQKFQAYFDREGVTNMAAERFNALREKTHMSGKKFRSNTEVPQNYWKSRCFTTQLQNYH